MAYIINELAEESDYRLSFQEWKVIAQNWTDTARNHFASTQEASYQLQNHTTTYHKKAHAKVRCCHLQKSGVASAKSHQ